MSAEDRSVAQGRGWDYEGRVVEAMQQQDAVIELVKRVAEASRV
jgi:hypothetical protein